MTGLIGLLILGIIIALVCAVCIWVVRMFRIDAPMNNVIVACIVLIGLLLWLVRALPLIGVST
jgi:membrane protein CcdC involved in cytochrome C biogenesis